jgi:hypothetical protein
MKFISIPTIAVASSTIIWSIDAFSAVKNIRRTRMMSHRSSNMTFQRGSKTVAYYKSLDDHEHEHILRDFDAIPKSQPMTAEVSQKIALTPMDLPRSVYPKYQEENEMILALETFAGRFAMVLAAYLFTQEILTGASLLDQMQQFFS